jgi:hypothetical protein
MNPTISIPHPNQAPNTIPCPECDERWNGVGNGLCRDCGGTGIDPLDDSRCETCGGSGLCERCNGEGLLEVRA